MAKVNYLLGHVQKLVEPIPAPKINPEKSHPYSLARAQERVVPKLEATAKQIAQIPKEACPNDEAVALVTLHPAYLAKSYFPDRLLEDANLHAVGSRKRVVSPDAWSIKNPPKEALTSEIFVAGKRSDFQRLARFAKSFQAATADADDFIKIEDVRNYTTRDKIRTPRPKSDTPFWEIILHATGMPDTAYVLEGFRDYLKSLEIAVDLDERLQAQGLCFLPVRIPRQRIEQVAQFSFLRAAREMPRMRPVLRSGKPSPKFKVELPDADVLDPSIRVVAFDGGLPATPNLTRWANRKKAKGTGISVPELLSHGLGVTSALLFGPLEEGVVAPQPYATVDHIRVLDAHSESDNSGQYFDIIKRIMTTLESGRYDFANFSIGPDLEIDDDNVHVWTAMLDQYLKRGTTLAGIAVGNTGELDHAAGLARAQVPSDCVNALALGSADRLGNSWKRSSHSSIGPGRSPGFIKPDLLGFGGSSKTPFYVIGSNGEAEGVLGTSYATPAALRMAIGARAHLGPVLSPLALKALLVHRAIGSKLPRTEVGWGKVAESMDDLLRCPDTAASIVFQGVMTAGSWVRALIPVPDEEMEGMVDLKATICYATDTDPQDPIHYTRSGLELRFRPHDEKRSESSQREPNTRPLFSGGNLYAGEEELRMDAHKWENTLNVTDRLRGSSIKNPTLDIHYNARESGGKAGKSPDIQYALIVTVSAKRVRDLYDRIVRRYRTLIEALRPIIEIPIRGS